LIPPRDAVLPLTARQAETLRVIAAFREATGEFPSQRYLARRLCVDLTVIQARLMGLYRRGWLETPTPAGLRCTHVDRA
jgi:hypothetical protein